MEKPPLKVAYFVCKITEIFSLPELPKWPISGWNWSGFCHSLLNNSLPFVEKSQSSEVDFNFFWGSYSALSKKFVCVNFHSLKFTSFLIAQRWILRKTWQQKKILVLNKWSRLLWGIFRSEFRLQLFNSRLFQWQISDRKSWKIQL